jgi:anti-sigma factor ChrR (cupin superfamily)
MLLNDDLTVRALVHAARLDWVPSPTQGVERRMLFRVGDEKARATSIVRYARNSHFPRHRHPGGEEFLVLEGTFQDETGEFPAGSYVRNPPGSSHAPGSVEGCTIFVKLWQFREDDRQRIVRLPGEGTRAAAAPGALASLTLFESPYEWVGLEDWGPGVAVEVANPRGLEVLVLSGSLRQDHDELEPLTWMRLPAGQPLLARAGPAGVRVWLKSAQLVLERVCALAPDPSTG